MFGLIADRKKGEGLVLRLIRTEAEERQEGEGLVFGLIANGEGK